MQVTGFRRIDPLLILAGGKSQTSGHNKDIKIPKHFNSFTGKTLSWVQHKQNCFQTEFWRLVVTLTDHRLCGTKGDYSEYKQSDWLKLQFTATVK